MKIDLMGNIVKIDTISLDEDLEISNGTIVLTGAESEAAIDAKKLHNITVINIKFFSRITLQNGSLSSVVCDWRGKR